MFFVVVKLYMIFAEFDYVASEADLEMKTLLAPDFWTMFRPLFFGHSGCGLFILHLGPYPWFMQHFTCLTTISSSKTRKSVQSCSPILIFDTMWAYGSGREHGGRRRGAEQAVWKSLVWILPPNHSIQTVLSPCHKQHCREFEAARHTHIHTRLKTYSLAAHRNVSGVSLHGDAILRSLSDPEDYASLLNVTLQSFPLKPHATEQTKLTQ